MASSARQKREMMMAREEPRPQGAGARAPLNGKYKKNGAGGATRYRLPDTNDAPAKHYGGSSSAYRGRASCQQGHAAKVILCQRPLGSPGAWGDRGFGACAHG